MQKNKNRQLILDALPGTQYQLVARLGVSVATVSRWLLKLVDSGEAHIANYAACKHCGHPYTVYKAGPAKRFIEKPKANTSSERSKVFREKRKLSLKRANIDALAKAQIFNAMFG